MKKLLKKILAVGLSATMMLGMAVTSFATGEDEAEPTTPTTPAAPSATVWVNGKDVKANSAKKISASYAKTAEVKLADLKAAEQKYAYIIEEDYKTKVTADLSAVTKEGTLVYKKMVTASSNENVKVTIKDASAVAVGTYTYSAAVAASGSVAAQAAKWSNASGVALAADAISVSGTPAADDTFTVALAWDTTECKDAKNVAVKEGATVAEDTVVKVVQQVREGLTASLPAKTKYLISVTGTDVTTYTDAFPSNKATKSTMASAKYDKKNSKFIVTAGKEKGTGKVWIAEYSSVKKAITCYESFDLTVNMAPSKFTIQIPAVKADAEKKIEAKDAITKKTTVSVGDTISLETLVSKPAAEDVTATTTYKWEVKLPKNAKAEDVTITPAQDTKTATIKFNKIPVATKSTNFTITCTNVQSQKKATFKVTVNNDITSVTLPAIAVKNAYEDKQNATVKLGADTANIVIKTKASGNEAVTKLDTTDKIKVYVANIPEDATDKGYTKEDGEKKDTFKLTAKCKEISAKLSKEGVLTVTAKKGTMPGTQAKLLFVVTHKDKNIDVYESTITVGTPATGLAATTLAYEVAPGKTVTLALTTKTPENADIVWLTDNKSIATVDKNGKVTAKKEGEVKITAKSGTKSVEFTVTVKKPEATTAASAAANS